MLMLWILLACASAIDPGSGAGSGAAKKTDVADGVPTGRKSDPTGLIQKGPVHASFMPNVEGRNVRISANKLSLFDLLNLGELFGDSLTAGGTGVENRNQMLQLGVPADLDINNQSAMLRYLITEIARSRLSHERSVASANGKFDEMRTLMSSQEERLAALGVISGLPDSVSA